MSQTSSAPLLESGIYTVHAVESGSSLILSQTNQNPPQLHTISLTGVICPRVARVVANHELLPDEPYSHEAREHVRRKLIGKSVMFVCDGKVEPHQRIVGRVSLQDGEDIGLGLATLGLGSVQERQGKGPRDYMEKLILANENAKAQRVGIYDKDASLHVRNLKLVEDANALLGVLAKEATHKVLVEKVLSGTTLIITINSFQQQCTLSLWGISSPSMKDAQAAPLAAEAKAHTERCLLHREINIAFISTMPNGGFNGSIMSGDNIFQEDLLRRGYAKTIAAALVGSPHRDRFIAAEKSAQERGVGLWKGYVAPAVQTIQHPSGPQFRGDRSFTGKVFQIVTADTMVVFREDTKECIKLSLASVRPSRTVIRDHDGKDMRIRYENYTWEARESLRKLCIGKEVRVTIDYCRTIEETKEVRPYATVVIVSNDENVGAHLISQGLAKAMCNGPEVASCADQLRDAESIAVQKKLGLHSGKESAPVRIVELSRITEKKARQYLAYFQRGSQGGRPPRLQATVEMVLGASSIRIYIPKENVVITLKLAGISTPQGAFGENAADPLSDEAKHFSMNLVQNRDVSVEVETVDKFGNFLGTLYFGDQQQNLSISLAKEGFGAVSNVDRLPYANLLKNAEKQAQDAKLGIWKDAKLLPSRVQRAKERFERAAAGTMQVARSDRFVPVLVTEVINATTLFMCVLDEQTKASRAEVEKLLESLELKDTPYTPKKDEVVLARFSQDSQWYRAKVTHIVHDDKKSKSFQVRFIDFGNGEVRTPQDIRVCEQAVLKATPALAFEAHVAFLKELPKIFQTLTTDALRGYLESAAKLYARQEYACGADKYYTLSKAPEDPETVTHSLIRQGMGIVHPAIESLEHAEISKIYKELVAMQEVAKKAGKNVWQYGTAVTEDDDDESQM